MLVDSNRDHAHLERAVESRVRPLYLDGRLARHRQLRTRGELMRLVLLRAVWELRLAEACDPATGACSIGAPTAGRRSACSERSTCLSVCPLRRRWTVRRRRRSRRATRCSDRNGARSNGRFVWGRALRRHAEARRQPVQRSQRLHGASTRVPGPARASAATLDRYGRRCSSGASLRRRRDVPERSLRARSRSLPAYLPTPVTRRRAMRPGGCFSSRRSTARRAGRDGRRHATSAWLRRARPCRRR